MGLCYDSYRAGLFLGRLRKKIIFMSGQVFVSAQNLPKITLHGNTHITAPIRTKKVPKKPF